GHEVLFLARLGFQVTAVDFAESAVESLKARIGDLPVTVLQRDIFTLGEDHRASFDVVLEHTCFCAIPLAMRPAYSRTMHEVLKGGGRIIGLFYETDEEEGPPFRTTRSDIEEYFSGRFNITRIERPHDSFEVRRGQEWFVEMTRL
ncbi:MAG: methyltransferase domain-containing protein, partial [Cyanothece sp. SIO1E1]|nr:methyltransferase domain-containing protein [Cyanothece sp. SIO1E1]